jgi:hypothetical protein
VWFVPLRRNLAETREVVDITANFGRLARRVTVSRRVMLPEVLRYSVPAACASHLPLKQHSSSLWQRIKRQGCIQRAFSWPWTGRAAQANEYRHIQNSLIRTHCLDRCGSEAYSRCCPWARCCACSSTVKQPDRRQPFPLSSEFPKSSQNRCARPTLLRGGCNLTVLPSHCLQTAVTVQSSVRLLTSSKVSSSLLDTVEKASLPRDHCSAVHACT